MNYQEYKQKADIEWENKRREFEEKGNIAYNRGLLRGLRFWRAYLFPLLSKPTNLGRIKVVSY